MYKVKASILDRDLGIVENEVTIQEYNPLNSFINPIVKTNDGGFEITVSSENATLLVKSFGYKDAFLKAKDINALGTVYLTEAVQIGNTKSNDNTLLYIGLALAGIAGMYYLSDSKKPKRVKL